ncbi:PREDICTED: uncharacterized protein LOC104598369 [Nelumbo nucifera]|uniref:Uncharacterized protein LOC104598369 n=1 Tax=Nelumbo nucifera TaxID=4432 RepID=A0A1U7ZY03_NELNU|nr:PREDICTED: uncharacterized protein LOC104598369 [Nelumbo nucifera]
MSHVQKYIYAEEAQAQLRDEDEKPDKKMRDTDEQKSERLDKDHKRQDPRPDHRPWTPPPTYWNFTLLNISRFEILMQICNRNYVRWPEKMKTQSNKRNRDKYYEFHKGHGHDTKKCFYLRNNIEDLIRRGYISDFIDRSEKLAQEERRMGEDQQPLPQGPLASVIHLISGGTVIEGESSSGRKKYARLCEIDDRGHKKKCSPSITFTDDNLQGVQTPHDNALVITAEVANFEVRWILVDTGSSADVLFEDAFEKFGMDREWLTPVNTPMMVFSGEPLLPTRRITLPLLIGDGDVTATTVVDFIVIRCHSSYNAILGRSTLNTLESTVLANHLTMKFLTKYNIWGGTRRPKNNAAVLSALLLRTTSDCRDTDGEGL